MSNFDICVIGGGPAGMMSAIKAGENGARVVLVEKNPRLGCKLLITGKGRCNVTNAEPDLRQFIVRYGANGKFLFSAFSKFGPTEVMEFFESRGLKLKTERGQRVFPASDQSLDVLDVLTKELAKNKVKILTGVAVKDFKIKNGKLLAVELNNGETIVAGQYILATGGKSYPGTGSSGEAFVWLKKLGHQIVDLSPALVPIKIQEPWVKDLQGLSLKNVEISVWQKNKQQDERFGEMLFTHFGISGPIVLDISKRVGELLKTGETRIMVDLKPALDEKKLDERVQRDFAKYANKLLKNALDDLLPQKMIPVIIKLSGIDVDKKVNSITRAQREKLVKLLKKLPMTAKGLLGFEIAIVTKGGVDLKEVDQRTMRSKIVSNLFFAGEILDIDGPTGGFNLQSAWSTGFVAGVSSSQK